MKNLLIALFALLIGFAGGLAYAWGVAPVEYVDASPILLRADFKDQYRIAIAASYASSHDLARARARLNLTSATDPLGELKAQAQRMVGSGDAASVELLVLLAEDLEKGVTGLPLTSTPFATRTHTPVAQDSAPLPFTSTPALPTSLPTQVNAAPTFLAPDLTITPRATSTPVPVSGDPFVLVGQETVCDPRIQPGLLQITLANARRIQVPGVEIVVIAVDGEDHLFTGFKPEVGDGYADFVMAENVSYSVRIVQGGTFVANLSAPTCTDPNGVTTLGGLALSFQQP